MLQVTIPVHPLTRAAVLCNHGAEPVVVENNHDVLFSQLAGHVITPSARARGHLTNTLTFAVNDELAAHLHLYGWEVGHRLFLWHKLQICLFALAHFKAKGKGSILPAIKVWLDLHQVDEDAYSSEAAHKLFQRFCVEMDKKNPRFFGQTRGKSSAVLSKKKAHRAKLVQVLEQGKMRLSEVEPELANARFNASAVQLFRRLPARLTRQVRTYIYSQVLGLTVREVAEKLGIKKSTAHYHLRVIARHSARNPALARLLAESCALPQEI